MIRLVFVLLALALTQLVTAESSCSGAEVKGKVLSAFDAATSQFTTVVADLELKCKGGVPDGFPLYAEHNGKLYSAAQSKEDSSKFQVSVSEETAKMPSSSVSLRIFDEEGYQQMRKGATANPLSTLTHSVRYPYSGFGINSELIVITLGAIGVYLAHGIRSRM